MCIQVKFICLPNSGVDNDKLEVSTMSPKSKRNALNIAAANITKIGVADHSGLTAA